MKSFKRVLSMVVLLVVVLTVFAIPASATLGTVWVDRIGTFRQTSTYNYITEYACAVQSILWGYPNTKSIIANSGKVDGLFGSETARAVKIFQQDKYLSADGIVGPKTWKAMATFMEPDPGNVFKSGSRRALGADYESGLWKFYYFDTYNTESEHFHNCSF